MNLKLNYKSILNKNRRAEIRKQLAEVFGLSDSTIFGWLGGRLDPPQRYHAAIAKIMGVEVSDLFPNDIVTD